MKLHYMIDSGSGWPALRARTIGWCLSVCWLIAGCAGSVVLDPVPPPGFDLGGSWRLDPIASDPAPETRELRARGLSISMAAQDFQVLRCRLMEVEQNRDSMGIAYDGGSYRDISWGVRQRGLWEVNAGWDEGELRILSKARDAKAEETMTLFDAGRRLMVRISIAADGGDVDVTRIFQRDL